MHVRTCIYDVHFCTCGYNYIIHVYMYTVVSLNIDLGVTPLLLGSSLTGPIFFSPCQGET